MVDANLHISYHLQPNDNDDRFVVHLNCLNIYVDVIITSIYLLITKNFLGIAIFMIPPPN